jgi:hypothetical protein
MAENEKLRSLLAEARRVLSMNCDSGLCCAVRARIDAALAEPMSDAAMAWQSVKDLALSAARERDEARAEVERLKDDLDMVDSDLQIAVKRLTAECERLRRERDAACMAAGEYSQDDVNAMTTDMIALRKEYEKNAYQRGAEAMREAAAKVAQKRAALYADTPVDKAWCRSAACVEEEIRALPTPEEK